MLEVAIVGDGTLILWQERGDVGSLGPNRGRLSLEGGAKPHQGGRSGGNLAPPQRQPTIFAAPTTPKISMTLAT
jgi:hypothetical protein